MSEVMKSKGQTPGSGYGRQGDEEEQESSGNLKLATTMLS